MRSPNKLLRHFAADFDRHVQQIRHLTIGQQVDELNDALRGHNAYYGVAGNIRALQKVHQHVERYWFKMLRSRSWAGRRFTWADFGRLKERVSLPRPKLRLPYQALQALAVL